MRQHGVPESTRHVASARSRLQVRSRRAIVMTLRPVLLLSLLLSIALPAFAKDDAPKIIVLYDAFGDTLRSKRTGDSPR